MAIDLPFTMTNAEGDAVRAVMIGHKQIAQVSTHYEGEPVLVFIARGDAAVSALRGQVCGEQAPPAPDDSEHGLVAVDPLSRFKPGSPQWEAQRKVGVSTGAVSNEVSS